MHRNLLDPKVWRRIFSRNAANDAANAMVGEATVGGVQAVGSNHPAEFEAPTAFLQATLGLAATGRIIGGETSVPNRNWIR